MRFLKLEILNLASLDRNEGEVINFEEGALGDSNIFSIVGPTGSGKSTILDAICLALYNLAPRYPRKKNQSQKIEIYGTPDEDERNRLPPTDGRNILTRGKKMGYSKLTFLANSGNVYRAEWHVRKKVKKIEEPKTFLYRIARLEEKYVEEECKWEDLPTIIGLDYEQFLRTVLIAQGSFANFLNAKEDDRFVLLEKLIGNEDTYRRIVDEIKDKKSLADTRYNEVNANMEVFKKNLLNEEQLNQLKEEIRQLEEEERQLSVKIKSIDTNLGWYTENEKQQNTITSLTKDVNERKAALYSIKDAVIILKMHDTLLPAIDMLREVTRLRKEYVEGKRKITEIADCIEEKNNAITLQKNKRGEFEEMAKAAQKAIDETSPHIQNARKLKTLLVPALSTFKEKEDMRKKANSEMDTADKAVKQNNEDIIKAKQTLKTKKEQEQKTKDDITARKKELDEAVTLAQKNLAKEQQKVEGLQAEELQQKKDNATEALRDLKEAISVVKTLEELNAERMWKGKRKQELETGNEACKRYLQQLNIKELQTTVEGLQTAYTLMTSEQWNLHRSKLKDNQPCPLCGSVHHPYIADQEQFSNATTTLEKQLQEQQELLRQQQETEKEHNNTLLKNEGELKALIPAMEKVEKDIKEQEGKWNCLSAIHPDWQKDGNALNALLKPYEQTKKTAEEALTNYHHVQKDIQLRSKEKEQAIAGRQEYEQTAADALEQAKKSVTNAENSLVAHSAKTENLLLQQKDKRTALGKAEEAYRQSETEVSALRKMYHAELDGKDPDEVERLLNKEKQTVDGNVRKKTEEISMLEKELGELKGKHTAQEEQLLQNRKQQKQQEGRLNDWLDDYNRKTESTMNMEDVSRLLMATDDWEAIRKDKDLKEKALYTAETLKKDAEQKNKEHQTRKPSMSIEELNEEKKRLTDSGQHQQLLEAKTKMNSHEQALKQMGDKAAELAEVTKNHDDWKKIYDAIGSDGKILRKIAQCYTLRFLIEHANTEIRRFNNRYELLQVKNSLGIRVIDHDRADDIRDTTSLSGGETFIVSLGLALGLSSLSSRNISFDNLFIDEGFGTLDHNTLDSVIDSLSMLQSAQGKKVGVISHTESMDRITTQIRIIKNGNSGSSHIEIYP